MNPKLIGAVVALALLQLVLQIVALVRLARAPSERVSIGGRRWAWALIILLGGMVGPILWFALGREHAPAISTGTAADETSRRSAVDVLYGSRRPAGDPSNAPDRFTSEPPPVPRVERDPRGRE